MRRTRNDRPKVWHNPELDTFAQRRRREGGQPAQPDSQVAKANRAALEALFAPRASPAPRASQPSTAADGAPRANGDAQRTPKPGRIVLAPAPNSDPTAVERQRLLGKLLRAEGRPGVTKAANEFLRSGFTFPNEQDVHLQLLEHMNEDHVRGAIEALATLLGAEPPRRRAVLESRLRRIEEFADEVATRRAAEKLRRQVSGRPDASPGGAG